MHLRTAAALLTLALAISGCTISNYDALVTSSISARFEDSDPADFGDRGPGLYPVHGVDVSKWQGNIDWKKAHAHGVSFAFIKATEGGDRVDARFDDYWRGARDAGIAHAPYHFYYFCTSPEKQAAWFIRNVPRAALSMPPVIDMEWNPHSPTCRIRPESNVVRRDLRVFAKKIEKHYGMKPIIYTTVDFHRDNLDGYFKDYPFWLRSVADHPENIYEGRDWAFWQYTGTGIVPGISGNADINVFAGNTENWAEWLKSVRR